MEVVGVIAAVPELVKLVQHVATAAGQISSGARMAKIVSGSQVQLELLSQVLRSIQQRNDGYLLGSAASSRLAPVLRDVQAEVDSLQRVINKANGLNGHSNVLKRAHIVLGGLEKHFKEHLRQIQSTTNLLQLYLAESALHFSQRSQLSKVLRPSTTDFIPEKLDGTAQWLWLHETFNFWMGHREGTAASSSAQPPIIDNVFDRILSIYGVKGSGKTVLSASVVHELRAQGHVALFFSFWAGSDDTRKSVCMLRSLLWQLLNTLPEEEQNLHIPRLLESLVELTKSSVLCHELRTLCECHRSSIYIILDGIDESVDDWNDTRSGPLANLLEVIQNDSNIRLLLVGRQSSLRSALSKWPLSIEITRTLVSNDMKRLIASELDNCPNITDLAIRERVRRDLESRSSVMFLWIKLVFKQLRQSFCLHEINSTLNHSPNELSQEYARLFAIIISRLGGHSRAPSAGMVRAKRLLCLIIGASRPLTIPELQLAYSYSFAPTTTSNTDAESYAVSQEAIIHACGDILTVQGDLVYFGHVSIREFLLRPSDQWTGDTEDVQFFCLGQRECQKLLALACLRYLKNVEWRRKDDTQSLDELTDKYPLLHYASSYMMSHILNSDPQFSQTSKLLENFLNSTDIFNWMEYVFSVDNGGAAQVPPFPLQFWDNLLQFLLAWDAMAPPNKDSPETITTGVQDKVYPQHKLLEQGDVRGACLELIGLGSIDVTLSQKYAERWYDFIMEKPEKRLPLDTHKLHRAVIQMTSSQRLRSIPRLQLIGTKVGTCLMHIKALANPLDMLFQALEKSFQGLSFLSLMAFGQLAYTTRPKQALVIFLAAAEKIRNRQDLKEAWVLAKIGDCLRCCDELRDEEKAERYYRQSMEILGKAQQNPLVILGWCSAARCRADCMLGIGRIDEAKELTKVLESRLLSIHAPVRDHNALYNWSYSMIWSSAAMKRKRIDEALCLGSIYNCYGLNEEIERLMTPVTQGRSYIDCMGHLPQFKSMNLLALATDNQGRFQEARSIWLKARQLLNRNDLQHSWLIDRTTNSIINTFCKERKFAEAEAEFSAFIDLSRFLQKYSLDEDIMQNLLKNTIDTYMALGNRDKAIRMMRECISTIQNQIHDDGDLLYQYLRSITYRSLAWGIYDLAEETIHRTLHLFQGATNWDFEEETEEYLYEALAFSLTLQNNPKQRDPYDCYLICIALRSEHEPEKYQDCQDGYLRNTRLKIGLARACETTVDRHPAAAKLYDSVAVDSRAMACCSWCIRNESSHLFEGRARLLEGKLVEAVLMFSQVIPETGSWLSCGCWATDYDDTIMIVSSNLYLSELFDTCGCKSQASLSRASAAAELQRRFYRPFESPGLSREQELSQLLLSWSASALEDALAVPSRSAKVDGVSPWKQFPFEAGWMLWDDCEDIDILHAVLF